MKIIRFHQHIYRVWDKEEKYVLYQGSLEGCEAYVYQNQNKPLDDR